MPGALRTPVGESCVASPRTWPDPPPRHCSGRSEEARSQRHLSSRQPLPQQTRPHQIRWSLDAPGAPPPESRVAGKQRVQVRCTPPRTPSGTDQPPDQRLNPRRHADRHLHRPARSGRRRARPHCPTRGLATWSEGALITADQAQDETTPYPTHICQGIVTKDSVGSAGGDRPKTSSPTGGSTHSTTTRVTGARGRSPFPLESLESGGALDPAVSARCRDRSRILGRVDPVGETSTPGAGQGPCELPAGVRDNAPPTTQGPPSSALREDRCGHRSGVGDQPDRPHP